MENNTSWIMGCGTSISLWYDAWCGSPLHTELAYAAAIIDQKVSSIITDGRWDFSKFVSCIPIALKERILSCHIPFDLRPDSKVWMHSVTGEFFAKIAYDFKRPKGLHKAWWQWLWSKSIPPLKSCFVWKLLHNKVPTDEQWRWNDVWSLCNKYGAGQCKSVVGAAVIYVLNVIWLTRNKFRFHNAGMNFSAATSYIMDAVSLAGSASSTAKHLNVHDFIILKSFKVSIRPPKAPVIMEVIWKPPPRNWIKINCDGVSSSSPGLSACGGIVRNSDGMFLGAFASSVGISNSLMAELSGAMIAIEFAYENNWNFVWLETDSTMVVKAFKSPFVVPWTIRNRWVNCINIVAN
ncbi:uncharacterized protein LOC131658448 [Vicia villosa]|uniref:uncharacterized protein LOC131658448 n=1 Tax=Vicia villosa TaxID=3911 RepID=UPI00273B64DE|nr:uncharacterized protein LOC131658448 [Vicia villosa]